MPGWGVAERTSVDGSGWLGESSSIGRVSSGSVGGVGVTGGGVNTLGAAVGGTDPTSSAAATSGSSCPSGGGGEPWGGSMGIVARSGGVASTATCESSSRAALTVESPGAADGVVVAGFMGSNGVSDGGVAAELFVSAGAGGRSASATGAAEAAGAMATGGAMGGDTGGAAGGAAGGGLLGSFVEN